jgi:hypothetical protein
VVIISSTPSKTILPPFAELKVGPLVNVPLFPPLDKSDHTVPEPGYDLVLAASKHNTNPSVIIFGL